MPDVTDGLAHIVAAAVGALLRGPFARFQRRPSETATVLDGTRLEVERQRVQSTLLRGLSHDFRTPLASIIGAGSALVDYDGRLDRRSRLELARTVVEEGRRLELMVSNVLSIESLESLEANIAASRVNLGELVHRAVAQLGQRLAERPLELSLATPDLMISADAVLLERLLMNLLENCLRYTPPGSPILLSAGAHAGSVVLEVSDRGPGLARAHAERVFERSRRVTIGPAHNGSLGLGLVICKAIADAHSARLEAENRSGGGLTVRLILRSREAWPLEPPGAACAQRREVSAR